MKLPKRSTASPLSAAPTLSVIAALLVGLVSTAGCLIPDRPIECQTDQACVDRYGAGFLCASDGVCENGGGKADFLEAPCDYDSAGPVFEEGTYNVGVILAFDEANEGFSTPIANATKLAQSDINAVGGIDGHKIGLIICDTQGKNATAKAAAEHLADVGVQAVVGPDLSSYTVEVAPEVLIPNDILTVSPSATTPALSGLDDRDLIWRTVPSDRIQSRALAELVKRVTDNVVEGPEQGEPGVVMLTREEDSYAEGLQIGVVNELSEDFVNRIDSLPYPNAGRNQGNDYTTIASKVAEKEPRVVMLWGLGEVWDIIRAIDTFQQNDHGISETIYIVADGGKDTSKASQTAEKFDSDLEPLTGRIWGTAPRSLRAGDYNPYKLFKFRWQERYSTDADSHAFVANAYDALYLIGLAGAAGDFKGPALAEGMKSLTAEGAQEVVANQNNFPDGVKALKAGDPIDFRGASGPIDFDDNGDPKTATISLWCYEDGAIEEAGDLLEVGSTEFMMQECPYAPGESPSN